jgi:HNH endonuclease
MQGIQVKKRISGWWYVALWGVYIILASTIGSALSADPGTEVAFEWILFLLAVLGSIILKVARSGGVKPIKANNTNLLHEWNNEYMQTTVWLQSTAGLSYEMACEITGAATGIPDFGNDAINMFMGVAIARGIPSGMVNEGRNRLIRLSSFTYQVSETFPTSTVLAFLNAGIEELKLQEPTTPALSRYIPREVMTEVWNRDGGRCQRCGSQVALEFDHIIPVSMGGSSTANNVQLLCQACNRSKGNRELG